LATTWHDMTWHAVRSWSVFWNASVARVVEAKQVTMMKWVGERNTIKGVSKKRVSKDACLNGLRKLVSHTEKHHNSQTRNRSTGTRGCTRSRERSWDPCYDNGLIDGNFVRVLVGTFVVLLVGMPHDLFELSVAQPHICFFVSWM
jgi:hypothetical protein